MPMPGEGAAVNFRPQSRFVNGGSPEQQQQQQQHGGSSLYSDGSGTFSRRSVSGGASSAAAMRMYLPLLGLVLVAGVMLATGSSWLHHSAAHMQSPERLSSTIEQLSQNQAQMMAMLQRLSTTANGGGGGAGSDSKDAAGAAAAAAAGSSSSGGGSTGSNAEPTSAAFAAIPALTQLHNKLLRKSHAYEEHRKVMLDTFEQLVHMEPAAAEAALQQQLAAGGTGAMQTFTLQLYKLLLSTGKLLPCREDTTLKVNDPMPRDGGGGGHWYSHHGHHASSSSTASSSAPRYFFATNLRDNTVNMPQFTLSLLQTLLRLPHGTAFVSAYESNSDDGAHGWVDVLQLALNVIGTPSDLVTRGMLVRLEGSNRIQHLARVRNMALAPLYQHYATTRSRGTQAGANGTAAAASSSGRRSLAGLTSDPTEQQQQWAAPRDSSPGSGRRLQGDALSALASASSADAANGLPGVLPWDPDYVVFVNDAFFCWSMVHRLLNYRADITCGADFWQNADATVELPADLASKAGRRKPHIPGEYRLERPIQEPLSPDQDNPIVFYDVWVARDLSGAKFWWTYPFVHDATTTAAAQKGLPFRASCCWNGLAVLRAAPFAAGLRIRPPIDQGECQGSECTMLCNDFARLGYQDVVVDFGVQMTYDWRLAREMLALGIEGIGQTTWAQAKAAGIAGHTKKPAYASMECCGLKSRFTQWVNFNTDCYQEDVFARNWTQRVLAGGV